MSIAPVALVAEKRHGAKVSLAVIRLHQLASWSWCRCGTQTLPAEKPIAAKPSWSKDTEPECETGVTIWCLPCSYSSLALYYALQGYIMT